MPLWLYFLSFLFCSVLFLNSNFIYYTSVSCVWFLLLFACNLTERENLQNSDCPFRFLFEDFRLCSRYNNVNYGACHVHKPLFGCSVATCRLACLQISLSINEKKLEKRSDIVQIGRWCDSCSSALCSSSHTARSFNQWQRARYLNYYYKLRFTITWPFIVVIWCAPLWNKSSPAMRNNTVYIPMRKHRSE